MINLTELTDHARYSEILDELGKQLGVVEILNIQFESSYQGHVDISALLSDGRVWSYYYSYGSCSGCDEWESDGHNNETIRILMAKESTFFDDIEQYNKFSDSRPKLDY